MHLLPSQLQLHPRPLVHLPAAFSSLNGSTVLGSVPLNNQGVATYMTSALPAGTDAINAVYAGNQNFTGSMATLMQQVTAPNFSLKSSATQLSLIGGDTGRLTITLTPVGGYTGMTSFSCAGLPQNETCGFNPPTLTADGSNSPATTTMTITTDGPGSGTVGLLRPQSPGTPALLASLRGVARMFRRPDPLLAEKTPQPAGAPLVLGRSSDWRPRRVCRDFRLRRIFSTENTSGHINDLRHGNRIRQQLAVHHDHADSHPVGHRAARRSTAISVCPLSQGRRLSASIGWLTAPEINS